MSELASAGQSDPEPSPVGGRNQRGTGGSEGGGLRRGPLDPELQHGGGGSGGDAEREYELSEVFAGRQTTNSENSENLLSAGPKIVPHLARILSPRLLKFRESIVYRPEIATLENHSLV